MIPIEVNSLVFQYILLWKPIAYGILFFAMIIEGEIFLFTAGFLASQGFIDPAITFLVLFFGVQLGDSLWYLLGYKINHSDTKIGRWLVRITGQFDEHLTNSTLRTIFISKFIVGFHHFLLARAGVLKIKYNEFFKDDFVANIAWLAIVGGLGFLSGASFVLVKEYLKFAEIALALGLFVFFILDYLVIKNLKKKL